MRLMLMSHQSDSSLSDIYIFHQLKTEWSPKKGFLLSNTFNILQDLLESIVNPTWTNVSLDHATLVEPVSIREIVTAAYV